jgi:hypothetical protein
VRVCKNRNARGPSDWLRCPLVRVCDGGDLAATGGGCLDSRTSDMGRDVTDKAVVLQRRWRTRETEFHVRNFAAGPPSVTTDSRKRWPLAWTGARWRSAGVLRSPSTHGPVRRVDASSSGSIAVVAARWSDARGRSSEMSKRADAGQHGICGAQRREAVKQQGDHFALRPHSRGRRWVRSEREHAGSALANCAISPNYPRESALAAACHPSASEDLMIGAW